VPDSVLLSRAYRSRRVFRDEVALLTPVVALDPTAKHPVVASRQGETAVNQALELLPAEPIELAG
jgi:hypothetical protein